MNPNVLTAAITASSSVAIAVTALVLAYRGFGAMDQRMNSMERRLELIEAAMDRRFNVLESDLKQFFRTLAELDKRLQRVEDKQQ